MMAKRSTLSAMLALLWLALISPSYAAGEMVGQRMSLSLPDLDGTHHTLEDWRGQVLLLNFWASWCPSCLEEIPALAAFQERYRDNGLRVVGVGVDTVRKLRNVTRSLGMSYPSLVAEPANAAQLLESWGNRSGMIPYTVVIDRSGMIAFTHRGILHASDLTERIVPLLTKVQQ